MTETSKSLRDLTLKTLFPVDNSSGWIDLVTESYLGAFQTDDPIPLGSALQHPTVYACVTQIAYDVGKLRLRVMEKDSQGITTEKDLGTYSKVLKKPNKYQTRQQFIESWLISLLTWGNTYVLKVRDGSGNVIEMYILDPEKVEPLVSDLGDVFYRLKTDHLTQVPKDFETVPASEIIHDKMATLFHPLIGVSPLYASNLATAEGLAIQRHSTNFFSNSAQPRGILTAPGKVGKETQDSLKAAWQAAYSGDNAGKIAVLSDGLVYAPLSENAADSELIAQLNWSDHKICSTFKVPPYKVHVGEPPNSSESEALDRKYYSDCLQRQIESIENLLDEGLSIPTNYVIEFNLDDLMRMDFSLKMRTLSEGVKGGILAPNEARKRTNYGPVQGGDTPYMQQQNYSLAALDERDKANPAPSPSAPKTTEPTETDQTDKFLYELVKKDIAGVRCA